MIGFEAISRQADSGAHHGAALEERAAGFTCTSDDIWGRSCLSSPVVLWYGKKGCLIDQRLNRFSAFRALPSVFWLLLLDTGDGHMDHFPIIRQSVRCTAVAEPASASRASSTARVLPTVESSPRTIELWANKRISRKSGESCAAAAALGDRGISLTAASAFVDGRESQRCNPDWAMATSSIPWPLGRCERQSLIDARLHHLGRGAGRVLEGCEEGPGDNTGDRGNSQIADTHRARIALDAVKLRFSSAHALRNTRRWQEPQVKRVSVSSQRVRPRGHLSRDSFSRPKYSRIVSFPPRPIWSAHVQ